MGFKAQATGAAQLNQQGPLIAQVGQQRYEVYDGDTLYALDEEDNRISEGLRVKGVQARETQKMDSQGVIFEQGQLGGDESKFILYDYLNKKGDSLDFVDLKEQDVGRGAGTRREVDFIDRNTGSGLAKSFAAADISPVTSWETEDNYEARKLGRLTRSIKGEEANDGLDSLRDLNPGQVQTKDSGYGVFKGLALNEVWYDPKYHNGVQWRNSDRVLWDEDREQGGFAKDPLSVAWDSGWTNAAADAGAFLNSLGVVSSSEWLQNKGDAITLRQNQINQENPQLKIQQLSDISADGYWDTIKNSVEWLGVNSAMSIPYMAAIGASAVGAAALAPVVGGVAATGLAITPAFALHSGSTWNQLDPDKKTSGNAGKVYLAGLAMTMLDRFALGKILKPGQLLTKEGKDVAISHIAAREGITVGAAKIAFNKAARDETIDFLQHNVEESAKFLREGKILKDTLAGFVNAAPTEAVTEALQELTSYVTAQRINGEPVNTAEMINIAANSAAAGFFIGGIAGTAGAGIGASRDARTRKQLLEGYDPTIENEYVQAMEDYERRVGSEAASSEGSINLVKSAKAQQRENAPAEAERDDGLFNRLSNAGQELSTLKDLFIEPSSKATDEELSLSGGLSIDKPAYRIPGVGETLSAVGKVASRLTRASTRVELRPDVVKSNDGYLQIFKRLDFHGTSGRNAEGRLDALSGMFDAIAGPAKILSALGLSSTGTDASKSFSRNLNRLGEAGFLDKIEDAKWQLKNMSSSDIQAAMKAIGTTDAKVLQGYINGAMRLNNSTNAQFDAELSAMSLEYGANSDFIKNRKAMKGYYWKSNQTSRSKVALDPEGFTKYINDQKAKQLARTDLSKKDREALKAIVPADYTRTIMDGVSISGDEFSLVGGTKWGSHKSKKGLLELGSGPDFMSKWGEENTFAALSKKGSDVAKRIAHLEFFGDGGSDLDFLFRKAIEIDKQKNGLTDKEAKVRAQRIAADYHNIIDAISNNYNRIKNPKVAKMQRVLLSYTTLVGLGLSGPASVPEFLTMALDLMSFKEARIALATALKALRKGFTSAMKNEYLTAADRIGLSVDQTKRVDNAMFDTLEQTGVPSTIADVYNKWGAEGGEPITETWQQVQTGFFKYVTLIHGITQLQRQMNASFGTDFARGRLLVLMNADLDGKMTRKQGEAYSQLKGLGMDVRKVMSILKGHGDVNVDKGIIPRKILEYDTNTISEIQQQALSNNVSIEQQIAVNARDKNFDRAYDAKELNDQMSVFLQNFVNQRIQNPGAANRALIVQDPRFHLVTQFNGFVSTITTTIVPKLWNDKVGQAIRRKDPTLAYDAFSMVVVLMVLGGLGQWMRDWVKYGEEASDPFNHPFIDDSELIRRAFGASGILGQFEKPLNWIMPRSYQEDEAFGVRVGSEFGGPILQHGQNLIKGISQLTPTEIETSSGGTYTKPADTGAAINEFLKSFPITSVLPEWRHSIVETFTDKEYK